MGYKKCGSGAQQKTLNRRKRFSVLKFRLKAEREGFEPSVPCGTPVFKTGAFGHSATSPEARNSCKAWASVEVYIV